MSIISIYFENSKKFVLLVLLVAKIMKIMKKLVLFSNLSQVRLKPFLTQFLFLCLCVKMIFVSFVSC